MTRPLTGTEALDRQYADKIEDAQFRLIRKTVIAPPPPPRRRRRGRGEGGVSQRPDGTWTASLSLGNPTLGKRKRKWIYGKTKREVLDKLDALRATARVGVLPDAASITVGQLLARWAESQRPNSAPRSHEQRTRLIDLHLVPRIGNVKLSALNPLHVEGLYADLNRAHVGGWTIRHAADLLGAALNHAVRLRLIASNPVAVIPKPRPPASEIRVLTAEQVKQLLTAAEGSATRPLLVTALGTGCRQGELLGLAWDDVDLQDGTLTVRRSLSLTKTGFVTKAPKTRSGRRTVQLPAFVTRELTGHHSAAADGGLLGSPVFCTGSGGYLDKKNVIRAFRSIVRKLAKADASFPDRFRFHDLRHTHASLLLSQGHSLKAVSQRLGHANPTMTLRVYAHVIPGDGEHLADGIEKLIG